ncbi:SUKH-4 family immunity protein [Streptomyces sp. NPDC048248]|uniref:SUKH-4 family immunity protein n=1 Tax=Streptomyces sp. NPDC048248 TaxID=3365523 RepID=UPI00371AFF54
MEFRLVGRSTAAHALVTWLASEAPDDHVRIVTGDPGCGKSWLLAWLAMAADTDARAFVDQSVAPPPPPDAFDLVLDSRGRTRREIAAEVERSLLPGREPDGPFPEGTWFPAPLLHRAAKRRGTPFTVALLDTARAGRTSLSRVPEQLIEDVLLPLVRPGDVTRKRVGDGAEPLRLLLDLPREEAEQLVRRAKLPAHALIDLDSPAFSPDRAAFRSWVTGLLRVHGSAYGEAEPAVAEAAAEAVTHSSWPNFLLAETISLDLRAREEVWTPEVSAPLPTTLEEAWRFFLASFEEAAEDVGTALTPVVLAEGEPGMPVSLAARAVSALSGQSTSEAALDRVVLAAAAFVMEEVVTDGPPGEEADAEDSGSPAATGAPGGPVRHLRLRDPALAEAARRSYGQALPRLQRTIATALAPEAVLTDAERAAAGMQSLSPEAEYVLGPGLAHAASGGVLDEWIADPAVAFLLDLPSFEDADGHADRSLGPELRARRRALVQAHRLYVGPRTGHVSEHASRLGLTAAVCDDTALLDWQQRLGVPRIWRTHWAHWRPLGAFDPADFDSEWPGPVELHGWRSVEGSEQFCTRGELSGLYQWWALADGSPVGDASTEPPEASEEPAKDATARSGPVEVVLDDIDGWVGVRPVGEESLDTTSLVCPEEHAGEVHPLSGGRALLLGRSGMMLIDVAQGRGGQRALPRRPRRRTSWALVDDALWGGVTLAPEHLEPLFSVVGRPVRADPAHLGPLASLPDTARLLTDVGLPASEFWFEGLERFVPTLPLLGGGEDAPGEASPGEGAPWPGASVIGFVGDEGMRLCVEHGGGRVLLAEAGEFVCLVNSSLDAFLRCWTVALKAVLTSKARDDHEADEFREHILGQLGRIDPACTRRAGKGSLATLWPRLVSDSTYILD